MHNCTAVATQHARWVTMWLAWKAKRSWSTRTPVLIPATCRVCVCTCGKKRGWLPYLTAGLGGGRAADGQRCKGCGFDDELCTCAANEGPLGYGHALYTHNTRVKQYRNYCKAGATVFRR